ncbi:MAG: hypothetical protein ACRECP_06085 [Methylocella sp.]
MTQKPPPVAASMTGLDEPAGNKRNACGGHAIARPLASCRHAFAIGLAILGLGQIARAADVSPPPQAADSAGAAKDVTDYFAKWFERVDATSAAQPSWPAPLTTVTPLLKEFVMYGEAVQRLPNGANVTVSDGGTPGAGIHLIPDYYNEIYIGAPPVQVRTIKQPADGFADLPFLLLKTRLASGNEENGDYVVTAYLAGQAPIGIKPFTNKAYYITPTIGAGKGWGDFDIQATVGAPWPTSNYNILGTQLVTNVAFQYHLLPYLWPEIELNDTYWFNGARGRVNQLFLTLDAIIGPYPVLGTRAKAALLVGYQTALAPHPVILNPLTPLYNHSWLFGARLFF